MNAQKTIDYIFANWGKLLILAIILILIWQYATKTGMFRPDPTKDEAHEQLTTVKVTDSTGNTQTVALSDQQRDTIRRIKQYFTDTTAWAFFGNNTLHQRCALCNELLAMSDVALQTIIKGYSQAYGTTVSAALEAIWEDPCHVEYSGLSASESAYDKLVNRIKTLAVA